MQLLGVGRSKVEILLVGFRVRKFGFVAILDGESSLVSVLDRRGFWALANRLGLRTKKKSTNIQTIFVKLF